MVVCKYFQQDACRFGNNCKFEHTLPTFGNRTKTFNNEEKNIALLVAQEVLAAERGGQWLLSCYGPFKEKKGIPGMDDVSPEEVRLEMYQARKNNTVDQVNAQFQQMCEQMKTKHEALKNPTPQLFQLLESLQNSGQENSGAFGDKKGNFSFGNSQLGSNTQTNAFGQKTFGATSNPFGNTNTFSATQSSSSIFGKTFTNNSNSVFGNKSNFGSTSVFGNTPAPGNSIFGGANKSAATPFGGVQNTQIFGGLTSQGAATPLFGTPTASQSTFGQTASFGANNQTTNSFIKPQTSVFGGASSSTNVFGGGSSTTGTSIFGSTAAQPAASNATSGSIFGGQSNSSPSAFGGAPVFGGSAGFGNVQRPGSSVFGGQSVFGGTPAAVASTPPSTNIFGGANTGASSFGGIAQNATQNVFGASNTNSNTNVFGGASSTVPNVFDAPPNASPFSTTTSTSGTPFGTATQATFVTAATTASVFGGSVAMPFSQSSSFGYPTSTANTTSANIFGSAITSTSTSQSPFGTSTFGAAPQQTSVFGTSISTSSNNSNPFVKASPFGTASTAQSSPFGNFAKSASSVGLSVSVTIDETGYSLAENLTDDEKAIYQMAQFPEGQIPLKPPTKELC